jgi:TolB-like protein
VSKTPAPIPAELLAAQLERLVALPAIRRSPNSLRLLRYLFGRMDDGRASPSQYEIAYEVLGLGKDYDPDRNPVVRMQLARLRRALELHYEGLGAADPLVVALPRGTYSLRVVRRATRRRRASTAPSGATLALAEFRGIGLEGVWRHLPSVLAEELMVALGRFPGLRVIGPVTRARLDADAIEPYQLGARLRASLVLDGSLQASEGGHVLRLRLLSGKDGAQAWSEKFLLGKDSRDFSRVERELVGRLAEELGTDFGVIDRHVAATAAARPAASLGTLEAVVTARAYFAAYTPELRDRALTSLRRACRISPDDPLPKAKLALVLNSLLGDATWSQPIDLGELERLAGEAYRLDPDSSWSLQAIAAAAYAKGRDVDLEGVAERVRSHTAVPVLVQGAVGLWLVFRRRQVDLGLRWVDTALADRTRFPAVLHLARVAERLLARDPEGLLAAIERYDWPGGWMDGLMRAAAASFGGDAAAARRHFEGATKADPTLRSHGLARLARIWHGDYVAALEEALGASGIPLAARSKALP